jgi:hypothetical protein
MPLGFPFLLDPVCAELFFPTIFSTIAKMRFVLDFDTPGALPILQQTSLETKLT